MVVSVHSVVLPCKVVIVDPVSRVNKAPPNQLVVSHPL